MSLTDQIREAYSAGLEGAAECARKRAHGILTSVSQYDREAQAQAKLIAEKFEKFADDLMKLAEMQRVPSPKA